MRALHRAEQVLQAQKEKRKWEQKKEYNFKFKTICKAELRSSFLVSHKHSDH